MECHLTVSVSCNDNENKLDHTVDIVSKTLH